MPRRSAKRPKPPPIILCSRAVFSADPSVTKNLLYNKDNTSGEKSQEGNTEKSSDFFVSILSALHRISFSREISAFDSRKRKNPWRSAGIFIHTRFVFRSRRFSLLCCPFYFFNTVWQSLFSYILVDGRIGANNDTPTFSSVCRQAEDAVSG